MSGPAVSLDGQPDRVRQRLVIVLPTTGEFDSRTYRIARSAAARGHSVTVLARWAPGLPREETHSAGYRIVRTPVSVTEGLPLPAALRRLADLIRIRIRSAPERSIDAAAKVGIPAEERAARSTERAQPPLDRRPGRLRGLINGPWRIAAIVLVVRSQIRSAAGADPGAEIYHAMAYMGIPVGLALADRSGGATIYDARDIYVDANNLARLPRVARWLLGRLERHWATRADRIMTVNRPYASVMEQRWRVARPAVILNCASRYEPTSPAPRLFHERLSLEPGRRVVLYQGGFSRHRGIEQLMTAILAVPDAVLVLLGYGPLATELESLVAQPDLAERVWILPAVPPPDLLDWVASADVVAMPIQPSTLNHRLTTPNKLFEAIAVGVPVVASDLPGMAGIVAETGCGLVVDPTDATAIASALRAILDLPDADRQALHDRCLAAAHATYNWEAQAEVLFDEYARLTGKPW